jgi:SNF2 family DNA or RNA helicase
VVLTTLGTARNDAAALQAKPKFLVVVDEAQTLKNPASAQSVAMRTVSARTARRIALSGTPVENSLFDLHALLDFVFPGCLGTAADFGSTLRRPGGQQKVQSQAAPFLLRRRKDDPRICSELPAKVEKRHLVELNADQRRLYRELHSLYAAGKLGSERLRFDFLSMQADLRRVCGHMASFERSKLVDLGLGEEFPADLFALAAPSAKSDHLLEILRAVFAAGEKVLVFCQLKGTVAILQALCAAQGLPSGRITGEDSVDERVAACDRFQTDAACNLLFLTMQAGGVGLTLTAATHVVHFDRCYNPAKEAQATDRAHRIGQRSVVTVHTIIAADTFEERLDNIIRAKLDLAKDYERVDATWFQDLSEDEIRSIYTFRGPEPPSKRRRVGERGAVDAE